MRTLSSAVSAALAAPALGAARASAAGGAGYEKSRPTSPAGASRSHAAAQMDYCSKTDPQTQRERVYSGRKVGLCRGTVFGTLGAG